MSGLEAPGLVLSVAGVIIAFKGALDTALMIESFFDDGKANCGYLALTYHIEKTRLQLWGELCKANDTNKPGQCTLRDKPDFVKETIVRILGEIRKLNEEANVLVDKHNVHMPKRPRLDLDDNLNIHAALPRTLSKISVRPKQGFRWTLKGKTEFETVVSKLRKLNKDLADFSLGYGEPQLLEKILSSHVLVSVDSPQLLKVLSDAGTGVDRALALSALAKSLQTNHPLDSIGSPSFVTNQQFKFLAGSSTIGILTHADRGMLTVWVEWNTFDTGPESKKYTERIHSLGYLLERVSEPPLRLPTCYGIYDDLAYEQDHRAKRIGYIFGPPQDNNPVTYDGNLRDHPPKTLSTLIKDQKSGTIPPLGDRFRLACTLAQAFSRFHSAGWLHKGLHSNSIVFLQRSDDQGITVTDPFITGFQYSRPQHDASLSKGPLEDKKLEHYYHPDADKGFSKQRDLYGLGVVLCEIGRWALVEDSVSDRTRARESLVDRVGWRKYMVEKVAQDLGWRMGTKYQSAVRTLLECRLPSDEDDDAFFAQQYLEKVIQPLSACRA